MKFAEVETGRNRMDEIFCVRLWKFSVEIASSEFEDSSSQNDRRRSKHFPLPVSKEPSIAICAVTCRVSIE
jgi:hypothetical protein